MLHPEGLEEKAWGLASRWKLPAAYDAVYIALAEMLDYQFCTADRRLAGVAGAKIPRLFLIPAPSP